MTAGVAVRTLSAAETDAKIGDLATVLIDCVEGGASVSFMPPLTPERAGVFWEAVRDRVAADTTELIVAELDGEVVGTVQLVVAQPENQPHRADVAKMLVRRRARRLGIGAALMREIERVARRRAKTLLVLDTATGEGAERLYRRLGWTEVGKVPGYALFPDGRPCTTTFFYKQLT